MWNSKGQDAEGLEDLAGKALLGGRPVEVAAGVVAVLGHGVPHRQLPTVQHGTHLMRHRHRGAAAAHGGGQGPRHFVHPTLAHTLESHPHGIVPIDDRGKLAPVLLLELSPTAVAAIAHVRPEQHVKDTPGELVATAEDPWSASPRNRDKGKSDNARRSG